MKKVKIFLLFLFLSTTALLLLLQTDWSKKLALKYLKDALKESGYQVEIGKIEGTIPHAIDLKQIHIFSDHITLDIDSLETRLSLWALLQRELLFTDATAQGISWKRKTTGDLSLGKGKGLKFEVAVKHFHLQDIQTPPFSDMELSGALRIGKKNRDFFVDLIAKIRAQIPGIVLRRREN